MATTLVKVRCLQRKLYSRSKQRPEEKFYSLYDKLYRLDILHEAYARCRANKGGAGLDGQTFEQIERGQGGMAGFITNLAKDLKDKSYKPGPIKRVMISKGEGKERPLGIASIRDRVVQMACNIIMQPIYDPHLHRESYGYRPKRSAQQAVKKIESYLKAGYTQVLDADLSGYFDSIPREELLEKVARRISDESLMKLLKQMLKAPIAQVDRNGKIKVVANDIGIGTPQGSCLSPLLANIYLNDFCKLIEEKTPGRIITYADDFVILSKQAYTAEQLEWVERRLQREGLTLNKDKTHCVDMSKEGQEFDFLGFNFKRVRSFYGKSTYIEIAPSKKSQKKFKEAIREIVKHRTSATSEVLVARVNRITRGWKNYFGKVGYPRKIFFKLDWFVVARFYRWSRNRSQRKSRYLAQDAWRKLRVAGLVYLQPVATKSM
jgi:group II intron reverse transcriptase/maturase